jgi:hypothetical protein
MASPFVFAISHLSFVLKIKTTPETTLPFQFIPISLGEIRKVSSNFKCHLKIYALMKTENIFIIHPETTDQEIRIQPAIQDIFIDRSWWIGLKPASGRYPDQL